MNLVPGQTILVEGGDEVKKRGIRKEDADELDVHLSCHKTEA